MARLGTPVTNDISGLVFDLDSTSKWRRGADGNATSGGFNQPSNDKFGFAEVWSYNHNMLAGLLREVIGEGALPGHPLTISQVPDTLSVSVAGGIVCLEGLFTFDALTLGSLSPSTTYYLFLSATRVLTANTTGNAPARSMYVGTFTTDTTEVIEASIDTTEQWVTPSWSTNRYEYSLPGVTFDRDYGKREPITTKTVTTDHVLTNSEARAGILIVSGTYAGSITLPAAAGRKWLVQNKSTQTIVFKRAAQTPGVSIATLKCAEIWCDGTDIIRATADVAY